ncbi:unnamed protein product [Caenorhabditis brenneri]
MNVLLILLIILVVDGHAPVKFDHDSGGEKFLRADPKDSNRTQEEGSGEEATPLGTLIPGTYKLRPRGHRSSASLGSEAPPPGAQKAPPPTTWKPRLLGPLGPETRKLLWGTGFAFRVPKAPPTDDLKTPPPGDPEAPPPEDLQAPPPGHKKLHLLGHRRTAPRRPLSSAPGCIIAPPPLDPKRPLGPWSSASKT